MGGRDVALLTGLWQQRDSGADEDENENDDSLMRMMRMIVTQMMRMIVI